MLTTILFSVFSQKQLRRGINKQEVLQRFSWLKGSSLFKQYLLIKVLSAIAMFTMVGKLPLILDQLNVSATNAGQIQCAMIFGFVIGTLWGELWAKRSGIFPVTQWALVLVIVTSGFMVAFGSQVPLYLNLLAYGWCFIAWGFIFANAATQLVGAIPAASGLAFHHDVFRNDFGWFGRFSVICFATTFLVVVCWFWF